MNASIDPTGSDAESAWLTQDVIDAVVRHMNGDHGDDTLAMARPLCPEAVSATVAGLDLNALHINAEEADGTARTVLLAWPGPLTERADIRRYVVELHTAATATGAPSGAEK